MKILFISHDATSTGAPIVLLELLKWVKERKTNIIADVLLLKGGPLEENFKKKSNNLFIYSSQKRHQNISKLFYQKIFKKNKIQQNSISPEDIPRLGENQYDLIYANTIVSISIASTIKEMSQKTKLLVHVHELNSVIKKRLPDFNQYLSSIDKIIAVSHLVKDNLISNWKVKNQMIEVIYPFSKVMGPLYKKNTNTFIVGASGNIDWNKGYDLFIQVAKFIYKKYPFLKIEFHWIGDNLGFNDIVNEDLKKSGIDNTIHFVKRQLNPEKYFKEFDIFLMTSREDSFPLVCIEVALMSKPIICFDKAVGTVEILKKGGGYIVPYANVEAMAEKVEFYYTNRSEVEKDGAIGKKIFADFTPEKTCPNVFKTIVNITS